MKQKPKSNLSMRNLLSQHQDADVATMPGNEREIDIKINSLIEEKQEQIINYNKEITTLNPDYTSLKPIRNIIVRVVLKEMERTSSGLLLPTNIFVKRSTEAGYGFMGEMESPFPYSQKAVVVALPLDFTGDLKVGQFVYLSKEQVEATAMGKGNNAAIKIANCFTHPELYKSIQIPTEPINEHYGYLKINYFDIDFIL